MIVDTLSHASAYHGLPPRIVAALAFLQLPETASLPDGRHDIEGDQLFALVQTYDTRTDEQTIWESHRRYHDVQFIAAGSERMGYAGIKSMSVKDPYHAERDVIFYHLPKPADAANFVMMHEGMFTIFMPHDAHAPGLCITQPATVKKIVIKAAV